MRAMLLAAMLGLATIGSAGCATQPAGGPAHAGAAAAPKSFTTAPAPGTTATCAVMGHTFKIKADTAYSVYQGRRYYFCCPGCKPKFEADPASYAK